MATPSHEINGLFDSYIGLEDLVILKGEKVRKKFDSVLLSQQELVSHKSDSPSEDEKKYAAWIAEKVTGGHRDPEATEVAYKAMQFAAFLCELLCENEELDPDVLAYYDTKPVEPVALRRILLEETQQYLRMRPTITGVLDTYMPVFAPGFRYSDVAEATVALCLIHADTFRNEKWQEDQVQTWSKDLELWDDNIEGLAS